MGAPASRLMHRPRGRLGRRLVAPLAALVVGGVVAACAAPAASLDRSDLLERHASGAPTTAGRQIPRRRESPLRLRPPSDPAWAPIDATGPAAREDHTWTVDPAGATAYLFGGRDGSTIFADLWATTSEPMRGPCWPRRRDHRHASGTRRPGCRTSGWSSSPARLAPTFFNDLWAYDPAEDTWTSLPSEGDVPVRALRELQRDRSRRPPVDQPRLHVRWRPLRRHARLRLRIGDLDR